MSGRLCRDLYSPAIQCYDWGVEACGVFYFPAIRRYSVKTPSFDNSGKQNGGGLFLGGRDVQ
jgi:hypothetical protein